MVLGFLAVRAKIRIMLIHIVCWKYKSETVAAVRDEHRRRLQELPTLIPDILSFDVGADILHLERSFDTGLVAHFVDQADLDRYTVHPHHQLVAAIGKQISEKVVSVDFLRPE
ncbi:hypothetical protein BH10ACI2_BH10ACI2_10760 [soil metagenome]